MRETVELILGNENISVLDASSVTTGKDFLLKIWKLVYSVPMVIALVDRYTPVPTLYNIYYELGVAQAMGKESVVVIGKDADVPTDLMRTEYVSYDDNFNRNLKQFVAEFGELADFYGTISEQLDRNPILAMDYLRRSYLISGNDNARDKARSILEACNLEDRARNSVEALLAAF